MGHVGQVNRKEDTGRDASAKKDLLCQNDFKRNSECRKMIKCIYLSE